MAAGPQDNVGREVFSWQIIILCPLDTPMYNVDFNLNLCIRPIC